MKFFIFLNSVEIFQFETKKQNIRLYLSDFINYTQTNGGGGLSNSFFLVSPLRLNLFRWRNCASDEGRAQIKLHQCRGSIGCSH